MKFKTNLAYSKNKTQTIHQPELFKQVHIGRVLSTKKFLQTKLYIFLIIVTSLFLFAFIFNLVKTNEITQKINTIKQNLKMQTSEKIRLKTELERKINLSEIEKYVKDKGMKKLNNNQINYIYSTQQNPIEILTNKSIKKTFIQKVFAKTIGAIKNLLKYFS